jgi:CubicO group peptidase (beta-lactamase class C family)
MSCGVSLALCTINFQMLRRTFLSSIALALKNDRLEEAKKILDGAARSGEVHASALCVRQGKQSQVFGFGKANPRTVFLLASITKPMTAAGVMVLVDRKQISLDDPVRKFIPEFTGGDRDAITVRHLLTHTSGLPDMLPENEALRKQNAPLPAFVAGTCKTPLLFKPGAECRYQSMGILLAAEIAERVTKTRFRDYLRKTVYEPLGMNQTALGLGQHKIPATAQCQVPENTTWHWNSPYWRDLGAPWGGAHSTTEDVARFLEYFLRPDDRVLRPGTAAMMVANQNKPPLRPWGIGWMTEAGRFGKRCSSRTYGHWGSTGTVAWADPASDTICVLLTTRPASDSRGTVLGPVNDAVAEAAA